MFILAFSIFWQIFFFIFLLEANIIASSYIFNSTDWLSQLEPERTLEKFFNIKKIKGG